MTLCYLGIGSNLGDSLANIESAYRKISNEIGEIIKKSSIYETVPVNPENISFQPNYLNSVILVETKLEPEELLKEINKIEHNLGRDRKNEERWGARMIDIDILYYGDLKYKSETLSIPHPEISARDFVLIPLEEIKSGIILNSKNIIRKIN